MNIHYMRAAVLENTGIYLKLEALRDILLEEKMISPSQAERLIFTGYNELYPQDYKENSEVVVDITGKIIKVVEDD